jgi:anti-anti-sigma regulatory factor
MLRVKTSHTVDILTFKLEGRLTGERAEQVRTLVSRSHTEMRLVVDITELMFVDALGEEVLSFFKRLGAQFVAEMAYSLDVCERLHLPLVPQQGSDGHPFG